MVVRVWNDVYLGGGVRSGSCLSLQVTLVESLLSSGWGLGTKVPLVPAQVVFKVNPVWSSLPDPGLPNSSPLKLSLLLP